MLRARRKMASRGRRSRLRRRISIDQRSSDNVVDLGTGMAVTVEGGRHLTSPGACIRGADIGAVLGEVRDRRCGAMTDGLMKAHEMLKSWMADKLIVVLPQLSAVPIWREPAGPMASGLQVEDRIHKMHYRLADHGVAAFSRTSDRKRTILQIGADCRGSSDSSC